MTICGSNAWPATKAARRVIASCGELALVFPH